MLDAYVVVKGKIPHGPGTSREYTTVGHIAGVRSLKEGFGSILWLHSPLKENYSPRLSDYNRSHGKNNFLLSLPGASKKSLSFGVGQVLHALWCHPYLMTCNIDVAMRL